MCFFFFYAWGLPPGEHYSKRPNHGQERSWRAEVQSKKKYIQQIVFELVLVSCGNVLLCGMVTEVVSVKI